MAIATGDNEADPAVENVATATGDEEIMTTGDDEAIATVETRPPRQIGRVSSVEDGTCDSAAGRRRCSAASGRAELGDGAVSGGACVAVKRPAKYQRSAVASSLTPFEPAADDDDSSRPVESAAQQLVAKRPDMPAPQFPVQTSSRVLVECAVQLPWIGEVITICAGPLCEPLVIGRPRRTTLENVAFPPEAAKAFAFQKLQPPTVER